MLPFLPLLLALPQDVCAEATFAPAPALPEARLGWTVAIDGDTAAVGASFGTGAAALSGVVRLYERTNVGWVDAGSLVASDGLGGDGFGNEIALDGDRLVVGAVWSDVPGIDSGAAYVFERSGGAWTETAKLSPSDHSDQDWFGRAVAIDGDRLIVGASLKANPAFAAGAVYVFDLVGGAWVETAKLSASDGMAEDFFGGSLDLDGDRILVGAHGKNDLGADSGGAYVFDLVGGAWIESARLIAADGQANDDLAIEVGLEGDTAVLTSYGDDDAAVDAGSVYVFKRADTGAWSVDQELFAADALPGDGLGSGVAIDGDTIAVGAQNVGGDAGRVYAFRRADAGAPFAQAASFEGAPPGSLLGFDVAVAGDLVLGGAPESGTLAVNGGEARAARLRGDATLFGCPAWIELGTGGAQTLWVLPGAAYAGDLYFVAGSASGASPGFALGAVHVPLNPDGLFLFSVASANTPPYQLSFAPLDGAGVGTALITLPAGTDPTLAGANLVHAALVLDPVSLTALAATDAAALVFAP